MSAVVHSISSNPGLRLRSLVALLVERQRLAAGIAAEARHQLDKRADLAFGLMACEHPEACSCPADYPDWTPGGAS